MEGNVYVCCWKRLRKQYRLWLKKLPDIFASDESFRFAEQKMWELICLTTGSVGWNTRIEETPMKSGLLNLYP